MSHSRSLGWQWFLYLLGIILTTANLTTTAIDLRTFYESACAPPGKLGYNLAVSTLSLFALTYHISAINTASKFRLWPWMPWINPALDALMFALWLAAAMTSKLNCKDLCNACSSEATVNHGNLTCRCFISVGEPENPPAPKGGLQVRDAKSSQGSLGTGWMSVLKQDLDVVLTILFLICLITDLYHLIRTLRHNDNTTTTPPSNSTRTIEHGTAHKARLATRDLVQYVLHSANVKSGGGQTPQPLAPPRYPQSAHHQRYFHSSGTPQRTGTPQHYNNVQSTEGVVETEPLAQPVEVERLA